ncbi:Rieske (2Fe-2S) protein [Dictyobacter arantiisoli]|uniref:tRNA-(Guanine-N1)-methyltransferase n=1 Tax=Dictyobacter arantiisoli TaxID=2014874 RepID=A0A5A5THS9_9CHLR|nr:Rieske 2Fe-2S domain-containing protein [Dictyobacter arantiisoli]GCF10613.1 tRNA-(guanine-N1)-methyltransferase [Dictyobacter arantiisoli]
MSMILKTGQVTYNLGPLARLPHGEGRTFQIGTHSIAVFRTRNDELYATQAACPHKGGPLADGLVGDGKVVCPLHSYKFQLATGASIGNTCAALETYPITLSPDGDILLSLDA